MSQDNSRIPYRHPQPKESPPELVIPAVIPADERVWVPQGENVWFRPLCLCASRGYWMNLLRVRKSGVSSQRHRHPCRCMAMSSRGAGVLTGNMTGSAQEGAGGL